MNDLARAAGTVMVIAKTPVVGRVKTRLCPPLDEEGACTVAWACLLDTLDEASAVPADRHVLVLDGDSGPWIPPAWDVIPQRGGGLVERLSGAFTDVACPAVIIAMDTPQVQAATLHRSLVALSSDADATIGLALDGGYWLLGLRGGIDPDPVFRGIPMSRDHTGAAQRQRLVQLGLAVYDLELLRDVDVAADVLAVAELVPQRRIAMAAALLKPHLTGRHV